MKRSSIHVHAADKFSSQPTMYVWKRKIKIEDQNVHAKEISCGATNHATEVNLIT